MKKRLTAVLLTLCLVLSLAACAPGENGGQTAQTQEAPQTQEQSSAQSSETPKSSEPSQPAESSAAEESSAPAADASESETSDAIDEENLKTYRDDLTEEDIQALKDAIGRAVISEYCEPNNIDPADFSWDVFTSNGGYKYVMWLEDLPGKIRESDEGPVVWVDDERIERVTVEDGADDNAKVTAAVCNGALDYLNTQALYNVGYLMSMTRIPHICDLVETIDLTALSESADFE